MNFVTGCIATIIVFFIKDNLPTIIFPALLPVVILVSIVLVAEIVIHRDLNPMNYISGVIGLIIGGFLVFQFNVSLAMFFEWPFHLAEGVTVGVVSAVITLVISLIRPR
jgi:intracellular septation protein A